MNNTYKIGQVVRFRDNSVSHGSEPRIIAQVDYGTVALIGLKDGNRWSKPFEVGDVMRITQEEMDKMAAGNDVIRAGE